MTDEKPVVSAEAPAAAPPPPPPETAEAKVESDANHIRTLMFGSQEDKEKAIKKRTPVEKPVVVEEKAEEETEDKPPEKPTETAPGKPKPPKKKPVLTPEEIIELSGEQSRRAVVEGVREAIKSVTPKAAEPEKPEKKTPKLPSHIAKLGEAIAYLETEKKDEYANLSQKVAEFWDEEEGQYAKYRKDWEKNNEGEEFDPDAEEHSEWLTENEPYVSPDALEDAKEAVSRKRIDEEVNRKLEEKLAPIRNKEIEEEVNQRVAPLIESTVSEGVEEVVKAVLGENAPKLKGVALIDEIEAKDPIMAQAIQQTAKVYVPVMAELVRLFEGAPYDPANGVHKYLEKYATDMETDLASMDPKQTVRVYDDGKGNRSLYTFAKRAEWARMNKAQQAKHWTVDKDMIRGSLQHSWIEQAKGVYGHYDGVLKNRKNGKATAAPAKPVEEGEDEEEESPAARTRSPAVTSSSPAPPPSSQDPNLKPGDVFFKGMGWK